MNQPESPQVKALKERYKASFPEKIELLNEQLLSLSTQASEKSGFVEVRESLHKLAGSSGMYGYDDISLSCRNAMSIIDEADTVGLSSGLKEVIRLLEQYI